MSNDNFDPTLYIEFMASIVKLEINEAWKPEVVNHILTAKKMMHIIETADIEADTSDFAPTFRPKKLNQ